MRRARRLGALALCAGVAASARSAELLIEWAPPAQPVDAYQVERRVDDPGERFAPFARVPGTRTSFADGSVVPGVTYCYRVRGVRFERPTRASAVLCGVARDAAGRAEPAEPEESEAQPLALSGPATTDRDVFPLERPAPAFPEAARARGLSGSVKLRFTVSAEGRTQDVTVIAAEPPGVFEDAAIAAVRRFTYFPRIERGQAVARHGVVTELRFEPLDDVAASGAPPDAAPRSH
jgi:TonB family protein